MFSDILEYRPRDVRSREIAIAYAGKGERIPRLPLLPNQLLHPSTSHDNESTMTALRTIVSSHSLLCLYTYLMRRHRMPVVAAMARNTILPISVKSEYVIYLAPSAVLPPVFGRSMRVMPTRTERQPIEESRL